MTPLEHLAEATRHLRLLVEERDAYALDEPTRRVLAAYAELSRAAQLLTREAPLKAERHLTVVR